MEAGADEKQGEKQRARILELETTKEALEASNEALHESIRALQASNAALKEDVTALRQELSDLKQGVAVRTAGEPDAEETAAPAAAMATKASFAGEEVGGCEQRLQQKLSARRTPRINTHSALHLRALRAPWAGATARQFQK